MAWIKIRKFIRFYLLAFVSALFILALTLFTFWETKKKAEEKNKNLFELQADAAKTAIEKRMKDYIQILKGAQGLFNVSDSVTRQEWKTYVRTIDADENYPGFQGIGFTLFLQKKELPAFEHRIRSSGFPDFTVWPEGDRKVYSSIAYLEPFDKSNRRAFGYDMFTDSVRREAMERARDTGNPALSGMVTLVQETGINLQKGFLLYLPVYKNSIAPQTVEERQAAIIGFVYSPFRANDLMNGILGSRFQELDIKVYDGFQMTVRSLLFDKMPIDKPEASAPYPYKLTSVRLGEHTWQLYLAALPKFSQEIVFPWFILTGGLLVSALIFIIMFSLSNVERSNYLKQVITDNATAALFILDTKGYCTFMNPAAETLTGFNFHEMQQQSLHHMLHHSRQDGASYPASDCPITRALSAKGVLTNHQDIFFRKNGEQFHVSLNTQPIHQNAKVVAHLIEVRDISQEKDIELAIREKNRNLQTLNNIGKNLSAELDLKKLLQIVTDSSTELTGAQFGAFFYNQINEKGEAYMLYNLSGVDPKAFSGFPMPRNTQIFSPTFHGEGILRSEDITQDPRYGKNPPYHGMPKGHLPVKSHLAVPVISRSGEVIGGLFFGHSKAGVFDKSAEEIVAGIAAQAAIAIDNSRLFETLSTKNNELIKINNDLDNFVYTASHDLKAPVLNIEGLIHILLTAIKEKEPEKTHHILEMISVSVFKFKETIQALTDVSKINKNIDDEVEGIDLQELLNDIRLSVNDIIQESKACIKTQLECTEVKFSKSNLKSILLNLISNAIKYKSPLRPPVIQISCKKEPGKILLSVSDNGLGIPSDYLPKIFLMFKRYHSHVEGSGVGLYLVKRIVENHGGSIAIQSEVDQGTAFTITLPELS